MNEPNQKQNKETQVPDSYNLYKCTKDVITALAAGVDGYEKFDQGLERMDPSAGKKFSNDGYPSFWMKKVEPAGDPQQITAFNSLIICYAYYFQRQRTKDLQSKLGQALTKLDNIETTLSHVQTKQNELENDIISVGKAVAQAENDLKAQMATNLKAINNNTNSNADRIIHALP